MNKDRQTIKATPAYKIYHQKVVSECVKLMGEHNREFFDLECDYIDEYLDKRDPAEVAQDQLDAF